MRAISIRDFFDKKEVVEGYTGEWNASDVNFKIINSLHTKKSVLSLGCGAGREVKALVAKGLRVTAIDISENMIKRSREIEAAAKYFCEDAVDFAKNNKNQLKFDYIIGLFSLLNYIKKKERREFVENLYNMLNKKWKIIFEVRRFDDAKFSDILKAFIAPFFALFFGQIKNYEIGDVWCREVGSWKTWTCSHLLTQNQLKKLFKGFKFTINKTQVCLEK